jgi:ATP-dependent DNA helicase
MENQRKKRIEDERKAATRRVNKENKAGASAAVPVEKGRRTTGRVAVKKEDPEMVVPTPTTATGNKRKRAVVPTKAKVEVEEDPIETKPPANEGQEEAKQPYHGEQPALITGATLKSYQLAGVQWWSVYTKMD